MGQILGGFSFFPTTTNAGKGDSGVKSVGGVGATDVNPLLLLLHHAASVMSESLGETTHADKGDDGRR